MKKIILFLISGILLKGKALCALGISISPNTWNIGDISSYAVLESVNISVTNTGSNCEEIWIAATNSANWTLVQKMPGVNTFAIRFKGGDVTDYTYLKTNYQRMKQWLARYTTMDNDLRLRFYGPSASTTSSLQTIYVYIQARLPEGFNYNQAGNFYWKDVGPTDEVPLFSWRVPYCCDILPSSYWSYMTAGTTVGWMTHPSILGGIGFAGGALLSINCPTCTTTITRSCRICGRQMVRWQTMGAVSQVYATVRAGTMLAYDRIYATTTPGTIINSNLLTSTLISPRFTWSVSLPTQSNAIFTLVLLSGSSYSFMEGCSYCMFFDYYAFYAWWVGAQSSSYVRSATPYSRIVILD